jgi:hypothetical protein
VTQKILTIVLVLLLFLSISGVLYASLFQRNFDVTGVLLHGEEGSSSSEVVFFYKNEEYRFLASENEAESIIDAIGSNASISTEEAERLFGDSLRAQLSSPE